MIHPKKTSRLRRRSEFRRVQKHGKKVRGQAVAFDLIGEKFPYPRLGITVTKRFGNAPQRNRFKRLVREVFRQKYPVLPPGLTIHISPIQGTIPSFHQLLQDFEMILRVE